MPQITDFKQDNIGLYIVKDNVSFLNYSLDWSDWVVNLPTGDSIASAQVTSSNTVGDSTSLEVSNTSVANDIVFFDLGGGETGQIYEVKVKVTTSNGYIDARTFRVKVVERQL